MRKVLEAKQESENKNIGSNFLKIFHKKLNFFYLFLKFIETFKKLEKGASSLEKELVNTKGLLEESENKVKGLENALQNAYKFVSI